ncbi:hypothetical protein SAICODRAFT_58785 [Saitoella complicata NRRL Y-17804]|uniref:uncharacterized protein n=1 Tax=Saitoella complicata (strain BCRC 22490 / CBS 7301 / JCM 7358 / NBRC 10748 / NRRL Y-17804) TaxID=698492 RepID=UPI000867DCBA|nr:uncharacterized protein SAICODRAFT_58785 [Saitoella complicata NRRL Y-17804]ODQ52024.1 hypothetical protein SAICODRAFT_58785 [Saitoella complicata NRRL Y-17804]
METDDPEDEDYQMLGIIENTRYISARKPLAKSRHFIEEVLNHGYDDERFKAYYQMKREDFHFVVGLIETNPVFYNNSACEQASVRYQLACILFRFGAQSSTSSSLSKTTDLFRIGKGTLTVFTRRVCYALSSLYEDQVKWPNPNERETIAKRVKESSAGLFEGVVGMVDGTLFTLAWMPKLQKRRRRYGLRATIVCDDQRLIRHFDCSLPGSQHDSAAYKDLRLHLDPDAYFGPTQYLLADLAYSNTMSVVTPLKQDQGYTAQKAGFNP